MHSEKSQRKTNIQDITYMWNLKYNTNESVYKTEANVHRKQVYGNWKGEGIREGQIRSNR